MTTAIVTRNPLISHCTVVAVTSMATAKCGRAMETIVSFRIITNAVTTMTPMVSIGLAARTGEGAVFPVVAELLVSDIFPHFPSARPLVQHPDRTPSHLGGGSRMNRLCVLLPEAIRHGHIARYPPGRRRARTNCSLCTYVWG